MPGCRSGLRVLRNIERIVREEQDAAGAQEMLMPTIQPAELWRESGRYDDYGKEMLRIRDRHERDMLYGPTNEEVITDLFRQSVQSYRELPQILYHIQWKFRDEVRPRFGVMRGREFLMKDAYSFDLDYAGAVVSYRTMMLAYMRTFQRMGLKAIPMEADSGPIGGDLSHEFIILAPTGESQVYLRRGVRGDRLCSARSFDYERGRSGGFFKLMTSHYAATDEKHDTAKWDTVAAGAPARRARHRGRPHLLLRHEIHQGDERHGGRARTASTVHPEMGSYGVGVSRLVGAVIEASHDDAGIIWPDSIAPFKAAILNLQRGDAACDAMCEELYAKLGRHALYDDRDERAGAKFADADLMGHPWQIIVGPRGAAAGKVELKRRATGERGEASPEEALGDCDWSPARERGPSGWISACRGDDVSDDVRTLRTRGRRPLSARAQGRAVCLDHRRSSRWSASRSASPR